MIFGYPSTAGQKNSVGGPQAVRIVSVIGELLNSFCSFPINGAVAGPDWLLGILFGAGGLMAMYLGARMQKYFSDKWLKLMLGTIVFIIASRYVLRFF